MNTDNSAGVRTSAFRFICCVSLLVFPTICFASSNYFWDMCKEKSDYLQCEEITKICSKYQTVAIPASDRPTEQEKNSLQGCSSGKLYYGYSEPSDPVKARKCAYLEIEQQVQSGAFDGIPILISVYANGEGVPPNYDLAMRFACEDANSAPAEYQQRLINLGTKGAFDYCQDITSGYMMGMCADRREQSKIFEREKRLSTIKSSWSEQDKQAFEKLQAIWQGFAEASSHEVGGYPPTASGYFVISRRADLEEGFVNSLAELESNKFPAYKGNDFVRSDRELNSIYKKIQGAREGDFDLGAGITKEDIKNAQRAWLKYRDAWIVFAKQKYPAVSAEAWKTWLTRERVEQLNSFLENPSN